MLQLRLAEHPVVMLDGDELREIFGATEGAHSRADRLALALRYAALCKLLANQGVWVAISTISMFREVHEWNRTNLPGYLEVFLDVPLSELARRDPKKIYEKARRGELKDVAGIDLPVDAPARPDVYLGWHPGFVTSDALTMVLNKLTVSTT